MNTASITLDARGGVMRIELKEDGRVHLTGGSLDREGKLSAHWTCSVIAGPFIGVLRLLEALT